MTAVQSVSAKPLTGFEKKKTLEHNGCEFIKGEDKHTEKPIWLCMFEGEIIAKARLQMDCMNLAIEALGGE